MVSVLSCLKPALPFPVEYDQVHRRPHSGAIHIYSVTYRKQIILTHADIIIGLMKNYIGK